MEIVNLESQVNLTNGPLLHFLSKIKELKVRHEKENENRDLEESSKAFAKLNMDGKTHYIFLQC